MSKRVYGTQAEATAALTAEAARLELCRFLLLELSEEYCADARERLRQGVLF